MKTLSSARSLIGLSAAVFAVSGCSKQNSPLASIMDSSLVSTAEATPAAPANTFWKERGAHEPLPQGLVPMPSMAPLAKLLKPGVVNIYTTSVVKLRPSPRRLPPGMQDPFEEFFRRFGEGQPEEGRRQSLGSGLIVNSKGYVLTNNHVVEGATEIRVKLDDGREFEAETVGRDPKTDVALLKLKGADAKDLPALYLGDSDSLQVGDLVIAAGNPFGLDHSVSMGIVSAKERVIGAGPYDDFIQTDAAINPGNSGGPLFNTRGEVMGVNTAIVAQGQGIGFAVPINMVKELLPQLLEKGKVTRGWLGVTIQDVTPEMAKLFKLNGPHGALISEVMRRSPAESAGLRAGDVVVGVNGRKIQTFNQLSRYVALVAPGNKAELLVLRDGAEKTFAVKVGERPEDEKLAMARGGEPDQPEAASDDLLGISVQPLSSARAHRMGVDSGVQIVSVDPDGPAARAGARAGDVIVEMQRRGIRSPSDYQAALGMLKPGDMALLRLQRQNASIYLAIRIPSR